LQSAWLMAQKGINVVFIGPPGAGKGTQAENLKKDHSICHLATGDMLRQAVSSGSSIGQKVKAVMDRGDLVSDEIMVYIIKGAINQSDCKRGFLLDGYPRTVPQAEKLDGMLRETNKKLDHAFEFAIADSVLVRRIVGRRIHPPSGRTYHIEFHPPKTPGKDDVTGEPLEQRADDNEATLKKRLETYHKNTKPVLEYYKKQGILSSLDAAKKNQDVYGQLKAIVSKTK